MKSHSIQTSLAILLFALVLSSPAIGQSNGIWEIKKGEIGDLMEQLNQPEKGVRLTADERSQRQIIDRNIEGILATSRIEAELRRSPHFANVTHAAFGEPSGSYVRSLYIAKGYKRSSQMNENHELVWKALGAGSAVTGGVTSSALGLGTSIFDISPDMPDLSSVGLITPESRREIGRIHQNDSTVIDAHNWRMTSTDPKLKWTNKEWGEYLTNDSFGKWQNQHNAQFLYDLIELRDSGYIDADIRNAYGLNDNDISDLKELVDENLSSMPNWAYIESAVESARQDSTDILDLLDPADETPSADPASLSPVNDMQIKVPSEEVDADRILANAADAREELTRDIFLGQDDVLLQKYIEEHGELLADQQSEFGAIRDRLKDFRKFSTATSGLFDNLGFEPPVPLRVLPAILDVSESINNVAHLESFGGEQLFVAIDAFTSITGAIKALSALASAGEPSFEEVLLGQIKVMLQNQKRMMDKLNKIDAKQNYLTTRFHDMFVIVEEIRTDVKDIERLVEKLFAYERNIVGPSLALGRLSDEWTSTTDRLAEAYAVMWDIEQIESVDQDDRVELVDRVISVVARVNRLIASSADNREEILRTFIAQNMEQSSNAEDKTLVIKELSRWPIHYQHDLIANMADSFSCSNTCSWMDRSRSMKVDLEVVYILRSLRQHAKLLGINSELDSAEEKLTITNPSYKSSKNRIDEISQYWGAVGEGLLSESISELASEFVVTGETVLSTLRNARMATLIDLLGGSACSSGEQFLPVEYINPDAFITDECKLYGRFTDLPTTLLTRDEDVDILLDPGRFFDVVSNAWLVSVLPFLGTHNLVYVVDDGVGEFDFVNTFASYEYSYFSPTYYSVFMGGTNMIVHFQSSPWLLDLESISGANFISEETKKMVKGFFPSLDDNAGNDEVPTSGLHNNLEGAIGNIHGYRHYILSGTGNQQPCPTDDGAYLQDLPDSRNCLHPISIYRYMNTADDKVDVLVVSPDKSEYTYVVEELLRGGSQPGQPVPRLSSEQEAVHVEYMDSYHKRTNKVVRLLAYETFLEGAKHYSSFVSSIVTGSDFSYDRLPSNRHQAALNEMSAGLSDNIIELVQKSFVLKVLRKLGASGFCEPARSELAQFGGSDELDIVDIAHPQSEIELAITEHRDFLTRLSISVERWRNALAKNNTNIPAYRWVSCDSNYSGTKILASSSN